MATDDDIPRAWSIGQAVPFMLYDARVEVGGELQEHVTGYDLDAGWVRVLCVDASGQAITDPFNPGEAWNRYVHGDVTINAGGRVWRSDERGSGYRPAGEPRAR